MGGGAYCVVVAFGEPARDRFVVVRNRARGWELPGGRIDAGEAPLAAAVREFGEETGHRLLAPRLVLRLPRGGAHCWVVEGLRGPPSGAKRPPQEDVVEVRLVRRLGDVAPLAFPDDDYGPIEAALGRPIR